MYNIHVIFIVCITKMLIYILSLFQNRFRFTGECNHPDAQIRSCQTAGSQFLITNQKFNITYKHCPGMENTNDGCK